MEIITKRFLLREFAEEMRRCFLRITLIRSMRSFARRKKRDPITHVNSCACSASGRPSDLVTIISSPSPIFMTPSSS